MLRKAVCGILLSILLFILMFLSAINIKPAKAEWTGTVYIRADGSIDPPDAPIKTYDNIIYTLTDNITSSGDGIVIERDNIRINGAGFVVRGIQRTSGGLYSVGIRLFGGGNVTIANFTIENFGIGIDLWLSSNSTIIENNIKNGDYGIIVSDSSNNRICRNNIVNNAIYGIRLDSSSNNNISRNNIANNDWFGICLWYSSNNNTIHANNITNNLGGIDVDDSSSNIIVGNILKNNDRFGIELCKSSDNSIVGNIFINDGLFVISSYQNIVVDNYVNDSPLVYLENISGFTVEHAGQVVLVNCNNIKIESINLQNIEYGIQLWNTSNSKISGNNITNNKSGICLCYSSSNIIVGNNIANSDWFGIWLIYSFNNSIYKNTFTADGLAVLGSYGNIIKNNTVNGNPLVYLECVSSYDISKAGQVILVNCTNIRIENLDISRTSIGVQLLNTNNTILRGNYIANNKIGIWISESSDNNVVRNNITNNKSGIRLWYSSNNNISKNDVKNNLLNGVELFNSSNNILYQNNFINNTSHVFSQDSINLWDNGYPFGGNYWSDYVNVDMYSGPYQNETGSDGIWDHPYIIDENNIDRYPLVNPFEMPTWSLAVTVYDYDGTRAAEVGGDTWVELIKEGEVTGVTQPIDEYSRAIFWDVEPGTYYVNVWHKPSESVASQEFWAQKTGIVVESGKSTTVEVMRHMPIITSFEVQQAPTKINEPTSITVTIKNIDSVQQWIKAKLIIKHESGEWVYQSESDSIAIQPGEETTFTFDDFAPNQEGTYYGYAICNIIGGGSLTTDQEGWKPLFVLGSTMLYVPYQHQDGTNWCAWTSLAMVLRYYGYPIHSWDIAEDLGLGKDEGGFLGPGDIVWNQKHKNLYDYIRQNYPSFNVKLGIYTEKTNQILDDIRGNVSRGYPVIVALELPRGLHAAVVVGYNETGFFVNDPSGAIAEVVEEGPLPDQYYVCYYISSEDFYELIDLPGVGDPLIPDTGTLLIVEGQPPSEYRYSATISIFTDNDILIHDKENNDYHYIHLDKGLTWKSTRDGTIDKNDALNVTIRISNHMPYTQHLIVQLSIWGEDGKLYYINERDLSIPPFHFLQPQEYLWEVPLEYHITKSQRYQVMVCILNQSRVVMDHFETPWFEYTANYNYQINVGSLNFTAVVDSNSTILNFNFNKEEKKISFMIEGELGTTGYCNITIPIELLGGPYTVTFDNETILENYDALTNGTHAFIYMTYNHSTHTIEIIGTTVIPEYPSTTVLPLFMLTTLIATILLKRKRKPKLNKFLNFHGPPNMRAKVTVFN